MIVHWSCKLVMTNWLLLIVQDLTDIMDSPSRAFRCHWAESNLFVVQMLQPLYIILLTLFPPLYLATYPTLFCHKTSLCYNLELKYFNRSKSKSFCIYNVIKRSMLPQDNFSTSIKKREMEREKNSLNQVPS